MSTYDDASLIYYPSGYKAGTAYSLKPTDGSGDLTFTRASTATRVNADGLIEGVRTNLITYSEQFDNAGWNKGSGVSVTANTTIAPTGTLTADTLIGASGITWAGSALRKQPPTLSSSTTYTLSLYVKSLGSTTFQTSIRNNNTGSPVIVSHSINSDTWTRVEQTYTTTPTQTLVGIIFGGTDGDVSIWGAQFEAGSYPTSYIPTTTTAVSVGMLANVPRIDYTSGCGKLLLEGQRTNVALNSETFGAGTGTTIVLNNTASPDGYVSADKLVEDTSTGVHITTMGASLGGSVDSSIYSVSVFVKAAGRTRIQFFDNNQASGGLSNFDLANGVVISGSGKIENYGNGWYRCIIFPVKDNSTTSNCQIRLISTGTTTSYTGDGTSGVFLWGKQIEDSSSYATSYIPATSGTAVTRLADAASKTGISSLIGQTEGTMFVDFNWQQKDGVFFLNSISDGTTDNEVFMAFGSTGDNRLRFSIASGGTASVSFDSATLASGTYKVAFAYANNDAVAYINGVQQFTDSSVTIPATSAFKFLRANDTLGFVGSINQQLLFPTRLTNTQLATLTTI